MWTNLYGLFVSAVILVAYAVIALAVELVKGWRRNRRLLADWRKRAL